MQTVASLVSFFLAMATNPVFQTKAQEEIDSVVGTHRLPEFADRPSLPYVEAIYREVMRWNPVLPLGLPHATTTDDVYDGYFVPKGQPSCFVPTLKSNQRHLLLGSMVISNIWYVGIRMKRLSLMTYRAMTRDTSVYGADSDAFNPERYFNPDGNLNDNDVVLAFGSVRPITGSIVHRSETTTTSFGRRICVGRYTADAAVWAAIVSVLATFRIAKAKDIDGNEIDICPMITDGTIRYITLTTRNFALPELDIASPGPSNAQSAPAVNQPKH
jgi:cytochrome P450